MPTKEQIEEEARKVAQVVEKVATKVGQETGVALSLVRRHDPGAFLQGVISAITGGVLYAFYLYSPPLALCLFGGLTFGILDRIRSQL